jgi:hypothetical protein
VGARVIGQRDPDAARAHLDADRLVPKVERILRQLKDAHDFVWLKQTDGQRCGARQVWNMRRATRWKA